MSLEKGRISGSQLVWLMMGFIFGSSLILTPGETAEHDAWLAVLIGLAEGSVFALVYILLSRRFPGKTLIQINDLVYGPYLGKLLSLSFLWYLLHLASLVLVSFTDFFTALIMPETPTLVFVLLISMVCAYAVRNGVEVISRCSEVLVPVTVFSLLLTFLLLVKDMEIKAFQPVLEVPAGRLFWAAHSAATFPFGETVAFLMIIPFLNKPQKTTASVLTALVSAGFFLLMTIIRNTGVLGVTERAFAYPSFEAVRLVNIGRFLTRVEILVAINFLTMIFLKIAVLFYGTVLGTAQLLGLRSYRALTLPIGVFIIILSLINFAGVPENFEFAREIYPIYALPFQVGIPLVTLILALIRKLPRREADK